MAVDLNFYKDFLNEAGRFRVLPASKYFALMQHEPELNSIHILPVYLLAGYLKAKLRYVACSRAGYVYVFIFLPAPAG
jgi:hypothetical protein